MSDEQSADAGLEALKSLVNKAAAVKGDELDAIRRVQATTIENLHMRLGKEALESKRNYDAALRFKAELDAAREAIADSASRKDVALSDYAAMYDAVGAEWQGEGEERTLLLPILNSDGEPSEWLEPAEWLERRKECARMIDSLTQQIEVASGYVDKLHEINNYILNNEPEKALHAAAAEALDHLEAGRPAHAAGILRRVVKARAKTD